MWKVGNMKVSKSQVFIAVVCCFLGFLLTYQFKMLSTKNSASAEINGNSADVISEIEALKKEKEELLATNNELSNELKQMEESAAQESDLASEIKNQLDTARMHLGSVDVKGPGVTLNITPKNTIFSSNSSSTRDLSEAELVHIVNLLWYSGAEAISINDIRITPQTGIKTAGSGIAIGSTGRVFPGEKISIKAIGDKNRMEVGIGFPGSLEYGALANYNTELKLEDDIKIGKSTVSLKSEFVKSVKE